MKITVSAFVLPQGDGASKAGVGRHIIHTLATIASLDLGHEYDIYLPDRFPRPPEWDTSPWVRWHPIPIKGTRERAVWEHFRMGTVAKVRGADVLFCPFPAVPLHSEVPIVSVIHDAFPRTQPEGYGWRKRLILDRLHALAASRSARVVTVSEWSAGEIARAYRIPRERIVVAYNGLGNEISPPKSPPADDYEPYFFTLSTLEPRKNLIGLLRAMALLPNAPRLRIAGARGWKESPIFAEVERLRLADRVEFLGYIPDEAVGPLMRGAELFILTSVAEGFGIPVLEAMAAGAAVACSAGSSLPEVAGDLAYYFDPTSPEEIARVIGEALADAPDRRRRADRGPTRASQFSWERSLRSVEQAWRYAATVRNSPPKGGTL